MFHIVSPSPEPDTKASPLNYALITYTDDSVTGQLRPQPEAVRIALRQFILMARFNPPNQQGGTRTIRLIHKSRNQSSP